MEIKVNTKFDIGQEVFICKETIEFKDGYFVNIYIPITEPYKVTGITVVYKDHPSIRYSVSAVQALFPESRVFSSLEEATKWCNSYE